MVHGKGSTWDECQICRPQPPCAGSSQDLHPSPKRHHTAALTLQRKSSPSDCACLLASPTCPEPAVTHRRRPAFCSGQRPRTGAGRRSHQLCCTPEGAAQRGPGPGAPPGGLRRSPQPAQARPGSAAWGRPEACGLPGARRARPARGGEVLGEGEPGA